MLYNLDALLERQSLVGLDCGICGQPIAKKSEGLVEADTALGKTRVLHVRCYMQEKIKK